MTASRGVTRDESIRTDGEKPLLEEDIYDVLRNRRRRIALTVLRQNGGKMDVRELADRIADVEVDESSRLQDKRQSVYVALCQSHLPKLDDFGIVEYDTQAKEATLHDRFADVEPYLDTTRTDESSWYTFLVGLGVTGLLVVVGSYAGVPVLGAVPSALWASVVLLVLVGTALYRRHQERDASHQ